MEVVKRIQVSTYLVPVGILKVALEALVLDAVLDTGRAATQIRLMSIILI